MSYNYWSHIGFIAIVSWKLLRSLTRLANVYSRLFNILLHVLRVTMPNSELLFMVVQMSVLSFHCIFELPSMPRISLLPCITAVHTLVAMQYLDNYKKAVIFIVCNHALLKF